MTIESICNQALDIIGYKHHIGSVWEGTPAARVMLDLWAETRDEILEATNPEFARKDSVLVALKSAPPDYYFGSMWDPALHPPLPYRFEYAYPDDCLVPLQIKPRTTVPVWRPRYATFRAGSDAGVSVILTDVPEAVLICTSRVLDPDEWHFSFTAQMIQVLAKKTSALFSAVPPQKEQKNADAA